MRIHTVSCIGVQIAHGNRLSARKCFIRKRGGAGQSGCYARRINAVSGGSVMLPSRRKASSRELRSAVADPSTAN